MAEAEGGGGSGSIFSSGSGHVTGVTSPNVVVGGGGERSRRSRRKDGGAVGEALPLLPPPLLSPPPAKPELEPQGVSAPHHPVSYLPRAPGTQGGSPSCRRCLRAPSARSAPCAPLPSSLPPGSRCRPAPPREHRQLGSRASGLLRAPLSAPPCRGAFLQVREGPAFPGPALPNGWDTVRAV